MAARIPGASRIALRSSTSERRSFGTSDRALALKYESLEPGGFFESSTSAEFLGALKRVLDDWPVGFGEVETCAIDFLVAPKPADGQRSRAA
jgi:hypothetical protein